MNNKIKENSVKVIVLIVTAFFQAIAINEFLVPNNIFTGGMSGVAQLVTWVLNSTFQTSFQTGIFILLFNIPIAIIGWLKIGGKFTIWSFINIFTASILTLVMPVANIAHNTLLASLFSGIFLGAASGLTLKMGFSTGGMDIVAMVLQKTTGKSVGTIAMAINMVIVVIAGFNIGWNNAMYTIIGIYATTRVIDALYTRHQKLTAFIVTDQPDAVIAALQKELIRGITVIPSQGAFSRQASSTLMMVLSKYELYSMETAVKAVDDDAFINLVNTVNLYGNFWDEDLQNKAKKGLIDVK